jgi:hypothetical protein
MQIELACSSAEADVVRDDCDLVPLDGIDASCRANAVWGFAHLGFNSRSLRHSSCQAQTPLERAESLTTPK